MLPNLQDNAQKMSFSRFEFLLVGGGYLKLNLPTFCAFPDLYQAEKLFPTKFPIHWYETLAYSTNFNSGEINLHAYIC